MATVRAVRHAADTLRCGTTTVRDVGCPHGVAFAVREAVAARHHPRPAHPVGGRHARDDRRPLPPDGRRGRRPVRGPQGRPPAAQGGRRPPQDAGDWRRLRPAPRRAVVAPARARRAPGRSSPRPTRRTASPPSTPRASKASPAAIEAGADTIEHGNQLTRELADKMAKQRHLPGADAGLVLQRGRGRARPDLRRRVRPQGPDDGRGERQEHRAGQERPASGSRPAPTPARRWSRTTRSAARSSCWSGSA